MAVVESGPAMEAAVEVHRPELIVCPMLKKIIPESMWSKHRCLIVHPGPVGDRGPSSLDWAIELGMGEWGVTVSRRPARSTAATSGPRARSPRGRSARAACTAMRCVAAAVEALVRGGHRRRRPATSRPTPLDYDDPSVIGRPRPLISQAERAIDWASDATARSPQVRAAEGHPGVLDRIGGVQFHLFGVHPEDALRGAPGEIIAPRPARSAARPSTAPSGSRT